MIFFTSGLWFDTKLVAQKRHYKDEVEMNNTIVANWNKTVTDSDTVYILGDVGEFGFLKSLNGTKIVVLAHSDKKFYQTYIEGVTNVRNDDYDKEMFEVYANQNYGVHHVVFSDRIMCKLYSGRYVVLTTDYPNRGSKKEFNLVGGIGDLQKVFESGINTDISLHYMCPLSEIEVETLIRKSQGQLLS